MQVAQLVRKTCGLKISLSPAWNLTRRCIHPVSARGLFSVRKACGAALYRTIGHSSRTLVRLPAYHTCHTSRGISADLCHGFSPGKPSSTAASGAFFACLEELVVVAGKRLRCGPLSNTQQGAAPGPPTVLFFMLGSS